jgi:hypothetical protein
VDGGALWAGAREPSKTRPTDRASATARRQAERVEEYVIRSLLSIRLRCNTILSGPVFNLPIGYIVPFVTLFL